MGPVAGAVGHAASGAPHALPARMQPSDTEGSLLDRIDDVAHLLYVALNRHYAQFGLAVGQVQLLMAIETVPGLSQAGYGRLLDVPDKLIAHRRKRLVAAGLVTQRADPANKHTQYLYRGEVNPLLSRRLASLAALVFDRATSGIPAAEQTIVLTAATRLLSTMASWQPSPDQPVTGPFDGRPQMPRDHRVRCEDSNHHE